MSRMNKKDGVWHKTSGNVDYSEIDALKSSLTHLKDVTWRNGLNGFKYAILSNGMIVGYADVTLTTNATQALGKYWSTTNVNHGIPFNSVLFANASSSIFASYPYAGYGHAWATTTMAFCAIAMDNPNAQYTERIVIIGF